MNTLFKSIIIVLMIASHVTCIANVAPDDQPQMVYANASDGFINIRIMPQSDAPVIGVFKNGPHGAQLLCVEGEWTKINYDGTIGYVYSKYVQNTPTEVFQEASLDDYPWVFGEWRNTTYGDIVDIYSDQSIRFLKNGLYWDEEEYGEYCYDAPMPETMDDIEGYFLNESKFPCTVGSYFEPQTDSSFKALLFNYLTGHYPFEPVPTYLGLDNEGKRLYYYFKNGEKVYLDKYSDNTFEESLDLNLKEKQKQLSSELASNQYEWLHGQWELDFIEHFEVNIDDDSVKFERWMNEDMSDHEVDQKKFPIKLQYEIDDFSHEVVLKLVPLDMLYVDKEGKGLYTFYDFDQQMWFDKVSEYTQEEQFVMAQKEEAERQAAYRKSQIIKYSIWAAIGVVGIVLLLLLVRWIKKLMPKIKASAAKASVKAKEKAKVVSDKAKESKDKLVDKSKELVKKGKVVGEQSFEKVKEAVKDKAENNQGKKAHTPWLILLLGVYLIVFFDIYIGLFLLIPTVIYLVLKKAKPEKAEQLVAKIKEKLQPITAKPMLKHGLIALLAGIVVLRTLGIIPGWVIVGLSVVFLVLVKFAPNSAQKIDDGCMGICDKLKPGKIWQNNWVKVAVFALLLLVPILGIQPGQSVYGIVNYRSSVIGSWQHCVEENNVEFKEEIRFYRNGSGEMQTKTRVRGNPYRKSDVFSFKWELSGNQIFIDGDRTPEFTYKNGKLIDKAGNIFHK